jgi:predicted nucleic acid-binding protein
MIYCDTSSLLKLIWLEPESEHVGQAVHREDEVVISKITLLEAEVQLRTNWLGGFYNQASYRRQAKGLAAILGTAPFVVHSLASSVFDVAIRQHQESGKTHCRSLDRLHLAAMEELGIRRLMTNDAKQADAARALGFEVLVPGHG